MGRATSERFAIEWAVAAQCLPGQSESGDQYLVSAFADGALAAVVDGLGHGPEAAHAARAAVAVLAERPAEPVLRLIDECHRRLRMTRGVVMSVVSFDLKAGTLTWAGVGDVEGVLIRADPAAKPARESILLRSGVVGYQLAPLRENTHSFSDGDTVLLATDGVRHTFAGADCSGDPQQIAGPLMQSHRKGNDDALLLAIRCTGPAS